MSTSARDAVVLITSRTSARFGTGFIVHHDDQGSFILTCAHVIEDVGGAAGAVINHQPDLIVDVVASGLGAGIDLTVLHARGLAERPVLKIAPDGGPDLPVIIIGFKLHTQRGHILRSIRGTMGGQVDLQARGVASRVPAWDLRIEGDDQLVDGYSGSPVIHEESGLVVAIASHLEREGRRGQGVSAAAVATIWPVLPSQAVTPGVVRRSTVPPTMNAPPGHGNSPPAGGPTVSVIRSEIHGDVVVGPMDKTVTYNYYGTGAQGRQKPALEEVLFTLRSAVMDQVSPVIRERGSQRLDLLAEAVTAWPLDVGMISSTLEWIQTHAPGAMDCARAVLTHSAVQERAVVSGQMAELQQLLTRPFGSMRGGYGK